MKKIEWRVQRKEAGTRLLQFLREHYKDAPSVKMLKRAIDGKFCTVNQKIETFSSYILQENDIVTLNLAAFVEKADIQVPVLFEDPELLIVHKPAGLICENKAVRAYFPAFKNSLELVHRLDKETSGVLVLAKGIKAKEKMVELFKKHTIRKVYLALVDGVVEKDAGTIDNYLGKKHSYQGQTIYGVANDKNGLHAVTHWKCVKRGATASLIACEPYTGRTHQLRVHLSGMGHPILGDNQYGKRFLCPYIPRRNLLHAYSISFKHPSTGKELKIIAPIPVDFKDALTVLKVSVNDASY